MRIFFQTGNGLRKNTLFSKTNDRTWIISIELYLFLLINVTVIIYKKCYLLFLAESRKKIDLVIFCFEGWQHMLQDEKNNHNKIVREREKFAYHKCCVLCCFFFFFLNLCKNIINKCLYCCVKVNPFIYFKLRNNY